MTKQSAYRRRAVAIIGSRRFFWGIVALLVLQAAWIACSGRYPMAFDEDFHLGIIRLYAHHLSPFWSGQPAGANAYGAVARDPSYLYHYLMSFPYRLTGVFTHSQTIQVMVLRFIDIGLFAAGLAIYRRLLLKTGASRAIVNASLLVFVLVPVVPLLAAQVNYDNLLIPLIGLVLLLAARFSDELSQHKRLNASLLSQLIILCLLASLVKYAFLPVFAVIVCYLAVRLYQVLGSPGAIWEGLVSGIKRIGRRGRWLLAVALILACGLFGERYGINVVRYHTPIPDCGKVLSVQACSAYGPWNRDYNLALNKSSTATHSPAVFAADWFYGMWLRMFFAVDGPGTDFQTKGPFVIPAVSAIVFAGIGVLAALAYGRRLFRTYNAAVLSLLLSVSAVYSVALWLDEYRGFLRTGQSVAINGRYLFPILPFLVLIGALGVNELCKRKASLKLLIGGLAVACLLWGGGALTYILRSNDAWYWPGTPLAGANRALQRDVGPLVPGYSHPSEFMSRN